MDKPPKLNVHKTPTPLWSSILVMFSVDIAVDEDFMQLISHKRSPKMLPRQLQANFLKKSENYRFDDIFRGYRNGTFI